MCRKLVLTGWVALIQDDAEQARVLLAPMSGVTDRPFRDYIRNLGQGQVVTEMIASEAAIRQVKDSRKLNQAIDDEPGIIVQLAGTEPELIAEAARIMEGRGAHTIDLNFGCPARKVVTKASGSALMRHESLCADIFETVRAAISVPLTVKMRLGWDDQSLSGVPRRSSGGDNARDSDRRSSSCRGGGRRCRGCWRHNLLVVRCHVENSI